MEMKIPDNNSREGMFQESHGNHSDIRVYDSHWEYLHIY